MKYQIIDNFLSKEDHEKIKYVMMESMEFPWFYHNTVSYEDRQEEGYFFVHSLYKNYSPCSQYYPLVSPILEILKPKSLMRIKANLYPNISEKTENLNHTDFSFPHNSALYYLNSNNGCTILDDDGEYIEVESVENRLLIFEGHKLHRSQHCTDQKVRVNISFSFF